MRPYRSSENKPNEQEGTEKQEEVSNKWGGFQRVSVESVDSVDA